MGRGRHTGAAASALNARRRAHTLVNTRPATTSDIPALAALKAEVARHTYEGAHPGPELESWLQANCGEAHYRYRVGRRHYHLLVATDNVGAIIGVASMRIRGERADMSGLYVKTPGLGVGTQLSKEREDLARELGCTSLRASVWRSNERARDFICGRGLVRGGGYRERTVGVMVDHYEGSL
jgi:GNAT superfamily N-acetyltransferase